MVMRAEVVQDPREKGRYAF